MREPRRLLLVARTVALVVLPLAVVACGGGDGDTVASERPGPEAPTTTAEPEAPTTTAEPEAPTTTAEPEAPTTTAEPAADDEGGGPCDGLDPAALADIVGEVAGTGPVSGEPTFGRPDGTEFTYGTDGCRLEVAVAGDDDPHEFSVSIGTAPDGVDLFEEFRASRRPEDLRPATGVGDEAFVDATFGDQSVQLIVDTGDDVLFVESDPPFGVAVAGDDVLIGLADLALG